MFKRRFLYVVLALISSVVLMNESAISQVLTIGQVEKLLANQLEAKSSADYYEKFSLEVIKENDRWLAGLLIGHPINGNGVIDPHEFLVKKEAGVIIDYAFIYSEKYDNWLDDLQMDLFDEYGKLVRYSSHKYHSLKKNLGTTTTIVEDGPEFAFPWSENDLINHDLWTFNSASHSYNGPDHPENTWSGVDFGESSSNIKVRSVADGGVSYKINDDCEVYVRYPNGWEARYLHVVNIQVKGANEDTSYPGDSVQRGDWLADVDMDKPICGQATGSHLHFDFRRNGAYVPADQMHIGGWKINSEGGHYEGYLDRGQTIVPRWASIFNFGYSGKGTFSDIKRKFINGVTLCSAKQCNVVGLNTLVSPSQINALRVIWKTFGLSIHFFVTPTNTSSTKASFSTTDHFACIDFDVNDLSAYNFPGTTLNLLQNATEVKVVSGDCNPADHPTKDSGNTNGLVSANLLMPFSCEPNSGLFTLFNDKYCYGSNGETPFQFFSLPFNPTKVQLPHPWIDVLVLFDKNGNCQIFGNGEDTEFFPQGEFVRGLYVTRSVGLTCETISSGAINDTPSIHAIMENTNNVEPPLIVWNMTDSNPNAPLQAMVRVKRGSTVIKEVTLPVGVRQWQPDIYDLGTYTIQIIVKGGSFDSAQEALNQVAYSIVAGPSWYPGWDEENAKYAGTNPETMHISVPTGNVLDLWGSNVKVNGLPIGANTTARIASNTVYRLGAGEYDLEWSNGIAYNGQDFGDGHHLWLVEKNKAIYGGTWTAVDLRNPSELPTTTPTATSIPSSTPTSIPTPSETVIATIQPTSSTTSTPIIQSTSTPTPELNPTATSTIMPVHTATLTATPTPESTVSNPTITATSTLVSNVTPVPTATTDGVDNQTHFLYLPLIAN